MTPLTIPQQRPRIETELGTEIQCARCEAFFPADSEFFFAPKGRTHSWCKACCAEADRRNTKGEQQ